MTRAQYASARKRAKNKYQKECESLAKKYFKANVPLKRNVVYETTWRRPTRKGLTNRFVVFTIQVQHFLEFEMFDVKAGVWWLDKSNNCVKWETLHGVDNCNSNTYKRSKDQSFIKPKEPLPL